MADFLGIVNNTPVPNMLIFFGGALLFLGFVGRFGTYVEIPPSRQRWAGGVGAALLLIGTIFTLAPEYQTRNNNIARLNQPSTVEHSNPSAQSEKNVPSVIIEGPPSIPFGQTTYFTILTNNAVRGVWSIGGFTDEPVDVNPLGASHQIYVEPTEKSRIDDKFTIIFTAYSSSGEEARAKKTFLVTSN